MRQEALLQEARGNSKGIGGDSANLRG